jgi:ubiquinone/menaquinone biosynthesis C-methylase UbiE
MPWFVTISSIVIIGLILYWLFVTTEGVYLGRRMVIWLYDITANHYDTIKEYTLDDEEILVVEPILVHLRQPGALVVDIATGTGRVPRFLFADGRFDGRVIGIDASRGMLNQARTYLLPFNDRVDLVHGLAEALPLPPAICPVLTCLEALEFIRNDTAAVREMVRVLQPGGTLLITRRRDREARLFFGRYRTPQQFETFLIQQGLVNPVTHPWQSNYDLVIAHKPVGARR